MNPATQALLQAVATTDASLTQPEKDTLHKLLSGKVGAPNRTGVSLLLTQKEATRLLSVSRVTLWRLTREGVFRTVEVTPGTFRYRREKIETFAERGIARPKAVPIRRRQSLPELR